MKTPLAISAVYFQVLISTALMSTGVNGYAKYWWEPALGVMPEGNPCHAHPERPYYDLTDAEGFFLESPHGIPYHEDGISFEFRRADTGELTTSVCPGANYTGKLSLPVLGLAMLSMSEGRFSSPPPTPGCRNRVDLGASSSPRAATSFAFAFTVPCNVMGGVEFKVTAAQRGYPATWMQSAATLELSAPEDCPAHISLSCGGSEGEGDAGSGSGGSSGDTVLDTEDDSGSGGGSSVVSPAGGVPSTLITGGGGGGTRAPPPAEPPSAPSELSADPVEPAEAVGGRSPHQPQPQASSSPAPSRAPARGPTTKQSPKQRGPNKRQRLSPPPAKSGGGGGGGKVKASSPPPGRKLPPPRKSLHRHQA